MTGGAGFIGSHFIRGWVRRHPTDELVNLDALTYAGSRERLADVDAHSGYRFLHGDICDPHVVRDAMNGCQAVVHMAAETHVDRSITNGAPFLRTNVEGTYVLLQEAQRQGVARVLHVSTDEVYGPILEGAVDEQAALSPRSPYAASKASGDLLAQAFHHTHNLPVMVVRPTNIYGPGQFPEKFIPLCITRALESRPIPIYGDGQQRRGWLFVEDAVEALEAVLERGQTGQVYNIGSGAERVNLETARTVLASLGCSQELLQFVVDRPGHDRRYAMHDAKLRALGWRPHTSFETGLQATVAWYRAHAEWWRPLTQRLREDSYHWLNGTAGASPRPALRAAV